MVPTGSSLGLGDTIQDTGVLYGTDTERYTYCMVPTLHIQTLFLLCRANKAEAVCCAANQPVGGQLLLIHAVVYQMWVYMCNPHS